MTSPVRSTSMVGRTVLVTGGAGGLGLGCAHTLVCNGAQVILADLAGPRLDDAAAQLGEVGSVTAIPVDLSDPRQAQELIGLSLDLSDRGDLHGLVNAVGVMHTEPMQTLDFEQWRSTMAINLDGVFCTLRAAANAMAAGVGGAIVSISSVAGRSGRPAAADYSASKTALLSLTKSAALAYSPKVRVNAVCPGVIWTRMWEGITADRDRAFGPGAGEEYLDELATRTPMQRIGTVDEVADAVLFLLSDLSRFITGQAVNVDGGLEMD
jgi:NAD(P)-dependent dehydrogenase (short-subunit alcohol dehydrogenase family)